MKHQKKYKSHNIIELENGRYCLYPNNRTRIYDNSLTPAEPLTPDFKVNTRYYEVENENKLERFGDSEEYFYKSKKKVMPYSVGKYAYGICDKTGFRYPLRELIPRD